MPNIDEEYREKLLWHYRNECNDDVSEEEFWQVLTCLGWDFKEDFERFMEESEENDGCY